MHRTVRRVFLLAAMAVPGHALPAAGQDAALRELVEAVVGGQLAVGAVPAGSPVAGAIPEGARVLGTVVQPWGSTVVLGMRGDETIVEQRVRDALMAQGWTGRPEDPQRAGFVSGPVIESSLLCRDASHLTLSITPDGAGESIVRLSLAGRQGGRSPCEPVPFTTRDSLLPVLTLPPGVQMTGGGGISSSRDVQEAQAHFETPLSVSDLAGHFARQVERQGWEATTERDDGVVALRTFTRADDDGRRLHGMLLIVAPPGAGGRIATFRVAPLTGTAR